MSYDDFVRIARRRGNHKGACIPFEVEGRRFEVVGGFLLDEDEKVLGKNALAQVEGAIEEEDFRLICRELLYTPENPLPKGDYLMTAARTEDGRGVKGLCYGRSRPNFQWNGREFVNEPLHWIVIEWSTEAPWDDRFLIIRRVK